MFERCAWCDACACECWPRVSGDSVAAKEVLMTCRIDRLVSEGSVVVIGISGRLTAHDVDMLRSLLEQEAGAVALDLRDLLFVDSNAVGLLARIEASGSELRNCPAYIRECVAQQRRAASHNGDI